eukprot:Protomagalhaensia_sp_Gyna_25__4752@NODE_46_length_6369_cov_203_542338_g31_i1_p3_GENE_NODE_46_length_6369_cov_203_542338_g31_i1NODE_46_length_6369_cov_203_542338_g31_i1_p3_ORF_typecomplete_len321_score30_26Cation_efflux/PF01545_21/8_4e55Zip/PF02535_22/0_024Patched/PF02460_18/0_04DUF5134/PF17197_4/1_7e03DUF5134/PF17197_4/0_019DUF5134/PF17197_4/3_7e03DUF2104/PF09877_9/1_1DUF2104/PF09877_9/4_5e03DUF2104/PF09877_9/76BT1/PF03092_16/68DUF1980/PF09323_10/4_9e03DUF1980/PF09323_10/0_081DUF1980/PF09323_10/
MENSAASNSNRHGPSATDVHGSTQKKLLIAIGLCSAFMLVELVAGIVAHSLAILTDAAHMLSDISSFAVSLFAIHISAMPGTLKMSFGYARAEILGALFSVLVIWVLTIWLVAEAIERIIRGAESVNGLLMVYTAVFGIVTNLILTFVLHQHHHHGHHHHQHSHTITPQRRDLPSYVLPEELSTKEGDPDSVSPLFSPKPGQAATSYQLAGDMIRRYSKLSSSAGGYTATGAEEDHLQVYVPLEDDSSDRYDHHDHHESLSVTAAYLHALGDFFQNIGVLVAGLIIWRRPAWTIADPICTLIFSVVVFSTTIGIIRDVRI